MFLFLYSFPLNNYTKDKQDQSISKMYLEAEKLNLRAPNIWGELVDEKGEKKCVPVYLVKSVNNRKGDNEVTCVYALKKSMFSHENELKSRFISVGEDDDGTYVWGRITLYYEKINKTGYYQRRILLTKVKAEWEVHSYQIKLSNRRVAYTCQSITNQKQTAYKYPSSNTVTYKTGFKDYVEDIIGSLVAAQMNVTCKRGTGSWRFTCQNRIVDKIPGLGDLIK